MVLGSVIKPSQVKVFKKIDLLQESQTINIEPDRLPLFLQHQFLHVSIVFITGSDNFITRV